MKKIGLLVISLLVVPFLINCKSGERYDDNCPYLTFNAEEDSSVKYVITGSLPDIKMVYSTDMKAWKTWNPDQSVMIEKEKKIYVRNDSEYLSAWNNYVHFVMDGQIAASGKISSLNNSNVLHKYEYFKLFESCKSLVRAPALPATTLADRCYMSMFSNCHNLKKAPELPATTLVYACYYSMFYNCTNLIEAPNLPATELAVNCYQEMFVGCHSLVEAPELPATTLADYCYYEMFKKCKSLTKAPKLFATTLSDFCYCRMFSECHNLETLKVGFGTPESCDWPAAICCTTDWLYDAGTNVANPTFIWSGKTSDFPDGWRTDSTIPEKWNVQNYAQ